MRRFPSACPAARIDPSGELATITPLIVWWRAEPGYVEATVEPSGWARPVRVDRVTPLTAAARAVLRAVGK